MEERPFRVFSAEQAKITPKDLSSTVIIARYFQPWIAPTINPSLVQWRKYDWFIFCLKDISLAKNDRF